MDNDLKEVLAAGRDVRFVLDLFEEGSDDGWPEIRITTRVTVADDGTILATTWPGTWKRCRVRREQTRDDAQRLFDKLVSQLSETNEGYGWYSSTDGKGHDLICYLYTPLAPLPKVELGGVKFRYFAELEIQLD